MRAGRRLGPARAWCAALLLGACVGGLASGLIAGPAAAQMDSREAIELQHQLLELKRDVQNLRDQAGRGGAAYAPSGGSLLGGRGSSEAGATSEITSQLLSRVAALEEQVRRLRGQLDETANQAQRQGDDLNKKIGDLNFRVQAIEPGGGAPSAPSRMPAPLAPTPPASTPSTQTQGGPVTAGPAKRTPEIALQEGSAALARRDYTAAEAAARDVLTNNKTSPRAYDAQLLLAQALSGRKEYAQSAIAYDDAYKRSRKGARAPDALLGLANSLNAIGERRAACDTLGQLRSEFPAPRPDLKDPIATATQRAGCK